jgi:hypothetical protein
MKKIYVQRKIEVWVEDVYEVDEINDEIIDRALDYDLDVDTSEVLWETQIDLGPVEVYNEQHKLIYSQKYDE